MDKKITFSWSIFFIALLSTTLLFLSLFEKMSTKAQPFFDIIIENVAKSGYSKTGELNLFWGLLSFGICLIFFLLFFSKNIRLPKQALIPEKYLIFLARFQYLPLLLMPNLVHIIVYQKSNLFLWILCGAYLLCAVFCYHYLTLILTLLVLCYYSVCGLCTFLTMIGCNIPLYLITYAISLFLLLLCIALILKKREFLSYALLFLQLPILAVLSIYFVDHYMYKDALIRVAFAPGYYIFFTLLIVLLLLSLIHHIYTCLPCIKKLTTGKLIGVSTVITLFIYNSYSACPMFMQPDQHHHGEQMIPWQQVFMQGQTLYEDYTPVSGLFPFSIGAIQHLLLGGTASDYSSAVSILMVIFCILTAYLIYKHVDGVFALMLCIFFCLPCYNRQYLVLPILLLLTLDKLQKKKLLWLLVWVFSSFLAGLYYPLFGAAILLSTLPLGLMIFVKLVKTGALKSKKTYPPVVITAIPIICSIPLLIKILNHTLTFSSQTILADGITLFGQAVPDNIFPYLTTHAHFRELLYFSLRFMLPMCGILFFCYFAFAYFDSNKQTSVIFISGAICLWISYTYTLVRADTGVLLSRTSYILCAIVGLFLPILLLEQKKEKSLGFSCLLLISVCISLPMLLYENISGVKTPAMWVYPNGEADLFFDDSSKMFSYYEVPELFVKAEDTDILNKEPFGTGFFVSDQLSYVSLYQRVAAKCLEKNPNQTFLGLDGQGFYYYTDVKACATGFIQAAKGYDAQKKIIECMQRQRPVVFLMEPECTYYAYYWMLTNNYEYCAADQCFYPKELFLALFSAQEVGDDYRLYATGTDFGLVCDSFGASFDLLKPLMISEHSLGEHTPFSGKDYDMLYLKYDIAKILELSKKYHLTPPSNVTITFKDQSGEAFEGASICCALGDGTLLIPVGMNPCWLLTDNITDISITLTGTEDSGIFKECLTDLKLYEIRK